MASLNGEGYPLRQEQSGVAIVVLIYFTTAGFCIKPLVSGRKVFTAAGKKK